MPSSSESLVALHLSSENGGLASDHAKENGGKPWKYALIPHTAIADNMTLKGLVQQYGS